MVSNGGLFCPRTYFPSFKWVNFICMKPWQLLRGKQTGGQDKRKDERMKRLRM